MIFEGLYYFVKVKDDLEHDVVIPIHKILSIKESNSNNRIGPCMLVKLSDREEICISKEQYLKLENVLKINYNYIKFVDLTGDD